ncbi:hypothetical protein [Pseudorhodobacter sp.]|uniref:hypothetical protein n=1 Tax=Pseudorhodobacter sp. TaxID=1934400 RepID=UPI0026481E60|nr:hypothetical protein [Pseudorhodobacter sp.]MDN5787648.1 hypothetical protein [Pseudorhodobacter sp.]
MDKPQASDRDLTLDNYRCLGVMEALDVIGQIVPDQKVQAVGYWLGGTLVSIAAAAMLRDGDDRLGSLSLLASQVDFTEPGELQLFINESQLAFLDSVMRKQGYLDTTQMAGAFQMLRSNDLIWSRAVHDCLMGKRRPMIDLMAWNAVAMRMPFRVPPEHLRKLYLNNDLAEGRLEVGGAPGQCLRPSFADLRCGHDPGPCRALAVGLQDRHAQRYRCDFRADQRRAQCGARVRTRSFAPDLPDADATGGESSC